MVARAETGRDDGRDRDVPAWPGVDRDMPPPNEVDRLRAERDEWRRRAEVAEAVATERLARAEAAERALATAEAAVARARPPGGTAGPGGSDAGDAGTTPRPKSLLERWRRYTDTIN
jgi:hypothetical protein